MEEINTLRAHSQQLESSKNEHNSELVRKKKKKEIFYIFVFNS